MRFHSSPINKRKSRSRIRRLLSLALLGCGLIGFVAWLWTYSSEIISSAGLSPTSAATILPVRRSAPPKRGKLTYMHNLVKFLRGKEYLVFQTDNRLSKMMDYGKIPTNLSSFETSVYGPSILAASHWAKANNYAYLLVVSPTRIRHPYISSKRVSEFWKKPEALIFLQRAARKAGMKGILYLDSDVVPHYEPLSLGATRRLEEMQNRSALTASKNQPVVIPEKVSSEAVADGHGESYHHKDSYDDSGIVYDPDGAEDEEERNDDDNNNENNNDDKEEDNDEDKEDGEEDEEEDAADEQDNEDEAEDDKDDREEDQPPRGDEERDEESNYDGSEEEKKPSSLDETTSESDTSVLDPCRLTNFTRNDKVSNIEQFLSLVAPNESMYHVILPQGHPSTNAWLNQRHSYPYKFLTVNAGAIFARTTLPAYQAFRDWYLDLIQKHIPFEATTAAFDVIHPSPTHRMQVIRRIRSWSTNKQLFPPNRDMVDESVCTPLVTFRWSENRTAGTYKTVGRFRCRGANMTMAQDLWSNAICNQTNAEKLFKLQYTITEKDAAMTGVTIPAVARIKCKGSPTIKYNWHIYKGWPGDQSRLQWLVYLDHMRKTNVFHIPTDPVLSCMDGRVPLRNRLLYHAGGREAKRLMGRDFTKLMMQQDLQATGGEGLCDPEWRHNWFESAWKEISELPAVRFTSNRKYRGTFDSFEEAVWRNRQPITLFNILKDVSEESAKEESTPAEETIVAQKN